MAIDKEIPFEPVEVHVPEPDDIVYTKEKKAKKSLAKEVPDVEPYGLEEHPDEKTRIREVIEKTQQEREELIQHLEQNIKNKPPVEKRPY